MIYIITFIFSFMFCSVGSSYIRRGRDKQAKLFFCLAVLIVSILAGIRDFNIGTDIKTYGHWMFLGAINTDSLLNYIQKNTVIEVGYTIFVYIVTHLFENEHWLYFFTGLFTYGFTMAGLVKFKEYIILPWSWCAYLFLLYGDTLNAMRQCMAVAIAVYAFSFVLNENLKKYIAWTVVACMFHNTAILSFVIFLIYWILNKKDTLITKIVIVLGTVIMVLLYNQVLVLFISLGVLNERFERYISSNFIFNSINPILVRLPFFIVMLMFMKVMKKKQLRDPYKEETIFILVDFLILMSFIEMVVSEMRLINVTLYRIAFYFTVYRCILMGRVIKCIKKENKIIIKTVFMVLLIVNWIYQNIIQGNNEIYPFSSELISMFGRV